MGTLPEQNEYTPGIYQIQLTDPIQGGEDGISNLQAKQLANRTLFLKTMLDAGHETNGSHKVDALLEALEEAISNEEIAPDANIDETKLNLYFRGAQRPGELGSYGSTREMAEDIIRLTNMNSLGDLLLSKTSMEILRDLTNQFYSSSGVLYAGGTSYDGYTAVTSGTDGGGIFTQDSATSDMSNQLQLVGDILFNVDGYSIRAVAPDTVTLPEAPDEYRSSQRVDLVYMETEHVNLTQGASFYPRGNRGAAPQDWAGMSEENKKLAAVDIHNNLYTGANYNVYQVQYEIKSTADTSAVTELGFTRTLQDTHLFYKDNRYAIELCTVTRRNQGAYHTTYNPTGTGAFYGDNLADLEDEDTHVVPEPPSYDIIATDTAANSFTIAGDHISEYPADWDITIAGTTDNDGDHTVVSATYDSGANATEIVVQTDMTANTGNVGTLTSTLWFKVNYCFVRVGEGLGSNLTGSIDSGICYFEVADTVDPEAYHDHILNTDVTDKRTYLETADSSTDPNLTLSTPILSGVPMSAYELETFDFPISNYNGALTYTVNAKYYGTSTDAGTITESDGVVSWTVPSLNSDSTVVLSVYAEDGSSNLSETAYYTVSVYDLLITGDDAVAVSDSDWASTSSMTVSSGLTASAGDATGYSASFIQESGDSDWGKLQVTAQRDLYEWTVDGTSTVSSLVLNGDHEILATDTFAIKYAGSTDVVIGTLDIDSVSWDGSSQNTLTLGTALPEVPEKVWDYDVDVSYAIGTETEALVEQTALSVDSGSTTTTQVVGDSGVSNLWVTGGYNNTIGITVNGTNKVVDVYGVSVVGSTYTIQIPEQSSAPSAAWKPAVYTECSSENSVMYNTTDDTVDTEYAEFVCYDNSIRQLKFKCSITEAGNGLDVLSAVLWKET